MKKRKCWLTLATAKRQCPPETRSTMKGKLMLLLTILGVSAWASMWWIGIRGFQNFRLRYWANWVPMLKQFCPFIVLIEIVVTTLASVSKLYWSNEVFAVGWSLDHLSRKRYSTTGVSPISPKTFGRLYQRQDKLELKTSPSAEVFHV